MTLVAEIPKNSREVIRVQRTAFQGHQLINARVWYRADDGELRPSKKGLSVKLDQADALADAIRQAASMEVADGP
ncbi:MAG: transcriptional coactivator p15/PC4 family protein [Pseudomonadota bacterium]